MELSKIKDSPILLGNCLDYLKPLLEKSNYTSINVLVDEQTEKYCLPKISILDKQLNVVCIQSGEINKNLNSCIKIWKHWVESGVDRSSLILNLGGGVIGDMGGFCATCYMRGVDFVQIPTTLLAQVDASIGGKLGVDFNNLKNLIGQFQLPTRVLIDVSFLETLPENQLRSGYAEVIKHSLIKDSIIWKRLIEYENWKGIDWEKEIKDSIKIKAEIVNEDPLEKGVRKILNFGHTIGHSIESISLKSDNPLLHGEAIAIGMICEAFLSHKKLGLTATDLETITSYILSIYPGVFIEKFDMSDVLNILKSDKKNRGGLFLFSLLRSIGDCTFDVQVTRREIEYSLDYYRSFFPS